MVWDFEPDLRTVIPVTDSERLDRKEFHTLRSIHATSFPHRQGDISFQIFRRNVGPTNQRSNIHNTLFSAASGAGAPQLGVHMDERLPHVFEIQFSLRSNKFCEFVLETVGRCCGKLLGQCPPEILGSFTLTQTTFIEVACKGIRVLEDQRGCVWTPFDNWLRIQHGLPAKNLFAIPKRFDRMVLVA
jgi:hypothetical protein